MTVERLAAELVDAAWSIDRALVQFVMDWRRYPEQREAVQASLEDVQTHQLVTRVRIAIAAANTAWKEHVAEQRRQRLEKEQAEAERQRHREDQLAQIKRDQLHSNG